MRRKSDYQGRKIETCSGNCRKPQYAPKYGDDGTLQLRLTGFVDTDKEISSYRNQTDMAYILSRLEAGDPSVMPDPNALYADVTGLPNTPIGMVNFLDDLRRKFDGLPAELRAQFGNDFNRFVAGVPIVQQQEPDSPPAPDPITDPKLDPIQADGKT